MREVREHPWDMHRKSEGSSMAQAWLSLSLVEVERTPISGNQEQGSRKGVPGLVSLTSDLVTPLSHSQFPFSIEQKARISPRCIFIRKIC